MHPLPPPVEGKFKSTLSGSQIGKTSIVQAAKSGSNGLNGTHKAAQKPASSWSKPKTVLATSLIGDGKDPTKQLESEARRNSKSPAATRDIFRKSLQKSFEDYEQRTGKAMVHPTPSNILRIEGLEDKIAEKHPLSPGIEPLFVLRIKLDGDARHEVKYYPGQKVESVAIKFCQEHKLGPKGIDYLKSIVEKRLKQVLEEKHELGSKKIPELPQLGDTLGKSEFLDKSINLNDFALNKFNKMSTLDATDDAGTVSLYLEPNRDRDIYAQMNDNEEEPSHHNGSMNILSALDENSPEGKFMKRKIEEGINTGYKIHMKHIKLHEKEM